jgi:hypothetical protein
MEMLRVKNTYFGKTKVAHTGIEYRNFNGVAFLRRFVHVREQQRFQLAAQTREISDGAIDCRAYVLNAAAALTLISPISQVHTRCRHQVNVFVQMPALHGLNCIAVQKPQGVCVVLAGIGQAQPRAQISDWGMRRPGS